MYERRVDIICKLKVKYCTILLVKLTSHREKNVQGHKFTEPYKCHLSIKCIHCQTYVHLYREIKTSRCIQNDITAYFKLSSSHNIILHDKFFALILMSGHFLAVIYNEN